MRTLPILLLPAALLLSPTLAAQGNDPITEARRLFRQLFQDEDNERPVAEAPRPAASTRPDNGHIAYRQAMRHRERGETEAMIARLTAAADAGHGGAAYELGMLYTQGRVVAGDLSQGATWINRAADLGDARALYLVGANLMAGIDGPPEPARGVAFLARAGEQGHARAQYLLGQAYVDGVGVPANPAWAARWYARAARAGHARAQLAYGVLLATGAGVPKDRIAAYRWLRIAARNGANGAQALAVRMEAGLTRASIERARTEATSWRPVPQARFDDPPTVRFVQVALTALGYDPGPIDGMMGRRTRNGIHAFRSAAGIPGRTAIDASLLDTLVARTSPSA